MTDETVHATGNLFGDGQEAEAARTSLEAAVALEAAPGPGRFFGNRGLLAEELRLAIVDDLLLARAPGRELYIYDGGVWRPGGNDAVKTKVVELLEDRNRTTHASLMVENILLKTPYIISDEPHTRYINFRNGMLDWKTGELHSHDPKLMSLNQLPYDWDPNATCPRTDQFMKEVFHTDAVNLGYEIIGYAMHDGNPLQKAVMLLGSGANGKGVFLSLVASVLGEDNVSAVPLQILSDNRFAAAELHGRLANIAGDLSTKRVEDTSRFKMITGGDVIRAERKFRDAFTFKSRALPMFSANELPGAADTSTGYIRRWLVVEFPYTFPPEKRDASLTQLLASERAGVAVKGVVALRRIEDLGGFTEVESVLAAQHDMATMLNPIKEFFDDLIEIDLEHTTPRKAIYQAYTNWCNDTGRLYPLIERKFWNRFRTELIIRMDLTTWDKKLETRSSAGRFFVGVRVIPGVPTFGGR